ncbi:MAG: hypothetical protein AAF668_02765 [Pseudomonadota bacterium]
MSPRPTQQSKEQKNQHGIVLPLVLILTVALSLVVGASYRIVSENYRLAESIVAQETALLSINSAEDRVIYGLLTRPLPAHLASSKIEGDLSDTTVTFYDLTGLGRIDQIGRDFLEVVFGALGGNRNASKSLTAQILDYQDYDNTRRFRGGERADYRLRSKQLPTNSLLRAPEELWNVLDARDALPPDAVDVLSTLFSFHSNGNVFNRNAAPPAMDTLIAIAINDGVSATEMLTSVGFNSGQHRFTLEYNGEDFAYRRTVDMTPDGSGVEYPYRAFWVSDTTTPISPTTSEP